MYRKVFIIPLIIFIFFSFFSCEIRNKADVKVAMICDTIGSEPFLLQAKDALTEMSTVYGFAFEILECESSEHWEYQTRKASAGDFDLIIGVGSQVGGLFTEAAGANTNSKYAVVDAIVSTDGLVTCIGFNETEGAYVLGAMVATAFADEDIFGYVCSFQEQGTYRYRYGFEKGLQSVNPHAKVLYEFTNSYTDTEAAYDATFALHDAGATFIMGGISASGNQGIYYAALELGRAGTPIYTSGLSIDQTSRSNPYIIGGLLKNTGACINHIIDLYFENDLHGVVMTLGVRENAFGVVHITTENANYIDTDIITSEVIAVGQEIIDDMLSGKLIMIAPGEHISN